MKNKKNIANFQRLNRILTFIIIILITILLIVLVLKLNKNTFKIDTIKECSFNFKEYLNLEEGSIYLSCLNEVKIEDNNKYITLKKYLDNHEIEEVLTKLNLEKELKDGGTKIYKDDVIKIIKCNTNDGNKDIYIGTEEMDNVTVFKNGACGKNFFSDNVFKRIYKLEDIKEIEKYDAEDEEINISKYELTLVDEDGNEATITKNFDVDKSKTLKENIWYEFTFENKYGELIKNEIKDILNNCTIKDIVKK